MRPDPVPQPILIPGIQITLTIDEAAFAGYTVHTFAPMMERYFLRYAGRDCMQLVVSSQLSVELYRGESLLGPMELTCL